MNRSAKAPSLFTLSFLLLAVLACNLGGSKTKESAAVSIPEDKKDYVGDWKGQLQNETMTLSITADGTVNYERQKTAKGGPFSSSNSKSISNGKITRFDGDDFEVKVFAVSTKFKVERPPHRDGDLWTMVVDGVELSRSVALIIRLAEMRKDDGSGNVTDEATDTFPQSDKHFHSLINWDNPRAGTKIRFLWILVDAGGKQNDVMGDDESVTDNDETDQVRSRFSAAQPLPKGSYKVEIYVNDKLEASLPFKVV